MLIWENFTHEWLIRSRRRESKVDDGDRFISLWIAFNGWMRGKYGENLNDGVLVSKTKQNNELEHTFHYLKENSSSFSKLLDELSSYRVANMRNPNRESDTKHYNGTYQTLIETIYSIRCNLFHGRKNIEDNEKDYKLVVLANRILRRLFTEYLRKYEKQYYDGFNN